MEGALEDAAQRGGQFWVGGYTRDGGDCRDGIDDWEAEEAELRRLIDEDDGEEDEMVIDPVLR